MKGSMTASCVCALHNHNYMRDRRSCWAVNSPMISSPTHTLFPSPRYRRIRPMLSLMIVVLFQAQHFQLLGPGFIRVILIFAVDFRTPSSEQHLHSKQIQRFIRDLKNSWFPGPTAFQSTSREDNCCCPCCRYIFGQQSAFC